MRQRITVQSHTDTRDAAGQAVSTWADRLTNEPARYLMTGGGTTYRGRQLEENVIAVFEVHYRSGYDTTQQVIYDGETYGITRIEPVDGGRRYLALHCKAVAA